MLNEAGLERVFGMSQLFWKHASDGRIKLLQAKLRDDFLLGRYIKDIGDFISTLENKVVVGKTVVDQNI